MRPISTALSMGAVVLPLLAFAAPGYAQSQGGLLDQAQKLLNGNSGNSDRDQHAYERGREDERRAQANRDGQGDRHSERDRNGGQADRHSERDQNGGQADRYSERDRNGGQGNWRNQDNQADTGYRNGPPSDAYRNGQPSGGYQNGPPSGQR